MAAEIILDWCLHQSWRLGLSRILVSEARVLLEVGGPMTAGELRYQNDG